MVGEMTGTKVPIKSAGVGFSEISSKSIGVGFSVIPSSKSAGVGFSERLCGSDGLSPDGVGPRVCDPRTRRCVLCAVSTSKSAGSLTLGLFELSSAKNAGVGFNVIVGTSSLSTLSDTGTGRGKLDGVGFRVAINSSEGPDVVWPREKNFDGVGFRVALNSSEGPDVFAPSDGTDVNFSNRGGVGFLVSWVKKFCGVGFNV